MLGIEIFGSKLPVFLSGLVILLILLLITILRVRKMYWDTADLSNRKKRRLETARPKVILIIVCAATCAITVLLALTIDVTLAIAFAIISVLVIAIVFSASGHGGGKSLPGRNPWLG
jgi:hypothetical protein